MNDKNESNDLYNKIINEESLIDRSQEERSRNETEEEKMQREKFLEHRLERVKFYTQKLKTDFFGEDNPNFAQDKFSRIGTLIYDCSVVNYSFIEQLKSFADEGSWIKEYLLSDDINYKEKQPKFKSIVLKSFCYMMAEVYTGFETMLLDNGVKLDEITAILNQSYYALGGDSSISATTKYINSTGEILSQHLQVGVLNVVRDMLASFMTRSALIRSIVEYPYPAHDELFLSGIEEASHILRARGVQTFKVTKLIDTYDEVTKEKWDEYIGADDELVGTLDKQKYAYLLGYPGSLVSTLEKQLQARKEIALRQKS